jgi:DNA-binding transcriptional MerR regulator
MKVEDVTGRAGVTSHAVRYYARFGLLEPERHPGNGYRVYPLRAVHRLRFIHCECLAPAVHQVPRR